VLRKIKLNAQKSDKQDNLSEVT